jgi:hypothetical protein
MGKEEEKPAEEKKSYDVHRANRRFERFLGINSSDLREDQGGSYYPFEEERFRHEHETPQIDPEKDGKLIATVTYDFVNKKVIIQRVGEPPIET